jgi:glycosyltransferase involved in cell wall biosynthesis
LAPYLKVSQVSESDLHSVVAPVCNEEAVLEVFHERLVGVLDTIGSCEVIYVDDGSTDTTPQILTSLVEKDSRVKVLTLSRNFGQQAALTAGLDVASGDTVTVLDADLQHPPELIPRMLEEWRRGADVVFAVKQRRGGEPLTRRVTSWFFYRLMRRVSGVDIPPDASEFRLMSRRAADVLRSMREYRPYVRGLVGWIGMQRAFVGYESDKRGAGESKYHLRQLVALAADAVFSFSFAPLRLAMIAGAALASSGFVYAIYAVWAHFALDRTAPGWASILIVTLVFGGMQLITLGIVGEYVGRTYGEARDRPAYLVERSCGFADDVASHYAKNALPFRRSSEHSADGRDDG